MLTALNIQNFVLIDQASLTIEPGLTALTGETGAGKSILLDALGLAVGGRSERGGIRQGAKQGGVSASFEVSADHPIWAHLADAGLSSDDEDQIILRRTQNADGRSRAFINDQPVSIAALRAAGEFLMEIHGQHDGRGFLQVATHRAMLDEFGGLEKLAKKTADLWRALRGFEKELEARRREYEMATREADYLRHVVETLTALDPQPDEETALAARRQDLMAAEKIHEDLHSAGAALDGGADESISVALRDIERAAERLTDGAKPLQDAAQRLESALSELAEARAAIGAALSAYSGDADTLEKAEERLFTLRAEARKHGVTPDTLAGFLAKTSTALEALQLGEAAFSDLETNLANAKVAFDKSAAALSKKRKTCAAKLDKAVAAELAPLKLGAAKFQTEVTPDPDHPGADGFDHVEFMVATNPGAPMGPLKTIASGGELSRFVLALKAALAAKENRTVIIFDEVDAGVGGAVADAVGERLVRLGADAQVLVVTHSPQVAARAKSHWRIEKTQTKASTTTQVVVLDESERTEEIARMLSGAKVTDAARDAARQLLGQTAPKTQGAPKRKRLAKAG